MSDRQGSAQPRNFGEIAIEVGARNSQTIDPHGLRDRRDGFRGAGMRQMNLLNTVRERMRGQEDRPFLIRADGSVMSYAAMFEAAARVAAVYRACGVEPGDRVVFQADKTELGVLAWLGALQAGAIFVPLNPAYSSGEVRYFLEDAEPRLFVCPADRQPEAAELARQCGVGTVLALDGMGKGSFADAVAVAEPMMEVTPRTDDDLAAILYTSGTTGRSKGAMLTQANLASNAETLRDLWRFTVDDRLLHALPIFHTHGLFVALNTTLLAGSAILFLPKFELNAVMAQLPKASVMMGVPTFYSRLLGDPRLTPEAVGHMRLFISGSAPLSAEVHKTFEARTGHAILERYGMTETNMITSNPYDGARKPGTVGPPLPGVEVRIAELESGALLDPGEIGVIEVRGPNVFKGYWRNPEKTDEEFRPSGFFITGDLGFVDPDGYVHIVGRAKDLIISGGFNIYPAEVEAAIEALPGLGECAVIGAPHPDMGEGVVAVIQGKADGRDPAVLRQALATNLAPYKQPRAFVFRDELPRNAMGKVEKKRLREELARIFIDSGH